MRDGEINKTGEAGFGKTTAALHRLASLSRITRCEGRALRSLVIVPTPGLARLSRVLLDRLGVEGAEVYTFDEWILREARRTFPHIPRRNSTNTTPAVMRLKRHPALREILPRIAARKPGRSIARPREDLLHLFGDRALMERVVERAHGAIPWHAIAEVLEHRPVGSS